MIKLNLSLDNIEDYRRFLKIKSLPTYQFVGRTAIIPDRYASLLNLQVDNGTKLPYKPSDFLFDYQKDISAMAIEKKKFSIFADCGLGKTLIYMEWVKYLLQVTKGAVLLISPLMVVEQTIQEAQKFYGDELPWEYIPAKNIKKWLVSGKGRLGITNFEAMRDGLEAGRLGAMIIDECFAADTLVDIIENGILTKKRIDNILCGDIIQNASGEDYVINTKRREVQYAVIVNIGKKVTCSPNHPFFTQRGWVCAQDLEPGDSILSTESAMRMVHEDFSPERFPGIDEILREVLLSEMAHESTGIQSEMPNARSESKKRKEEKRVVGIGKRISQEGIGTHSPVKSNEQSRGEVKSVSYFEENEAQTFRAWWKRSWIDSSTADTTGCTRTDLAGGICLITGQAESGLSHELQTRLSEYREKSVYRSGWNIPSFKEEVGCKEGCKAAFVRVEGLEILERGHPELERLRSPNGKLYFYDIEAERHPSFSVGGVLVHNSSMLKSHYGKWGTTILHLGRGLEWKLCGTGTPAPNDRIEYANHAVFMDAFPNVNSFLARFFINRGQTPNRWELKAHAVEPFYRALSYCSIFLSNPATYGWSDHSIDIPPIHVHIHHVSLTDEQNIAIQRATNQLFVADLGGIGMRGKVSQISKGSFNKTKIPENKTKYIRSLVDSWQDESTIIWCHYNAEQIAVARKFPEAAYIDGSTPHKDRMRMIDDFKAGRCKVLITKPKILGFGLNLQIATRQIFSGLQDSYESYYQAVKRSNRVGSTKPLNVHIPVTDAEMPMVQNVLRKAKRVQIDTEEQERIFKKYDQTR